MAIWFLLLMHFFSSCYSQTLWVNTTQMAAGMDANCLLSTPFYSNPDAVVPNSYGLLYFVPGPPNATYTLTWKQTLQTSFTGLVHPISTIDDGYLAVYRYSTSAQQYENLWGNQFYDFNPGPWPFYTDCSITVDLNNTPVSPGAGGLIVNGMDAIYLELDPSGQECEHQVALLAPTVTVQSATATASSQINPTQPELPADRAWTFGETLTIPGNFFVPTWKFQDNTTQPTGWSIDPDTGDLIPASTGALGTGTLHVECYEGISFTSGPGDINFPSDGVPQNNVTKNITVVAVPGGYYEGAPYAGGVHHHQLSLHLDSYAVFNNAQVTWGIVGSTLGCSLANNPDHQTATLTLGDEAGDLIVGATDEVTGYYLEFTVAINPEPTVSIDRIATANRYVQALVSQPLAFANDEVNPHISWSIQTPGALASFTDPSIGQLYIDQNAAANSTFTIRATDTDDGYYVEQSVTIQPSPQVQIYSQATQLINPDTGQEQGIQSPSPACLVVGKATQPTDTTFLAFTADSAAVYGSVGQYDITFEPGNDLGCRYNNLLQDISPGNEAGVAILKITDPSDGFSWDAFVEVRPVPSITFSTPDSVLKAWGSSCGAQANGVFDSYSWFVSSPYGNPGNNAPTPPSPQISANGALATVTSGTGWSDLPYKLEVAVEDPNVGWYYWATSILTVRPMHPVVAGPYPNVVLSESSVPSGGSVKVQASIDHPEQMNFPVLWSMSALSPAPIPPLTGPQIDQKLGVITPGTATGQVTVFATDGYDPGYAANSATLNIEQAKINFDKTVLLANGTSSTLATLQDPNLFTSVNWTYSGPADGTHTGTTDPTQPYHLVAGETAGTITLTATDSGGADNNYSVQSSIEIHTVPTISFNKNYLVPGMQAQAAISDTVVFPAGHTTWALVPPSSDPTKLSLDQNGLVTTGAQFQPGTPVTVQATSPDGYVITGQINTHGLPMVQITPPSLHAGSKAKATASVPSGTLTGVTWTIGADPNSTGTTVTPNGIITPGATPGTVTIVGTDSYNNSVQGNFTVTSALSMVFSVNPLKGDGRSKCWASVNPRSGIFLPVWSIPNGFQSLGCHINPVTGEIIAGRAPGKITVRATDSTSGDYVEGTLTLQSDCLTMCGTGNCVGGGGQANNNSVDVAISMGYADYGQTEVSLRFEQDLPAAAIVSPQSLYVAGSSSPDVEVIPASASDPTIQQVKSPTMLAVVHVVSASEYDVNLYSNDQLAFQSHVPGTPYVLAGTALPFSTWSIVLPTPGDYTHVVVTENREGNSYVATYAYRTDLGAAVGVGWDMTVDGGTRKERRTKTTNPTDNTETYTMRDAVTDAVGYQEVRNFHVFPWGEEVVGLTVGTGPEALTTTWSYYTDPTDAADYGRISQVILPGNSWETYKYDSNGRQIRMVSQFLDNPLPASTADENNNQVTTTTYDDVHNIAEETVKLQGIEISHKYTVTAYDSAGLADNIQEVKCQNRGVTSITAPGNLATVNAFNATGTAYQYLPSSTTRPDGTVVLYGYSTANGQLTKTIKEGQPNANASDVIDGVKTVTVLDHAGNVLSDQQFDIINSSLPLSSRITTSQDIFGRPLSYIYGDGSTESIAYTCCGIQSIVDRAGMVMTYDYDNMKRQSMCGKAGISLFYEYNIIGKMANETRYVPFGPDSAIGEIIHAYVYDNAGRMIQSTDPIGTTMYGFSTDGNGHQVVTTTHPNQSTLVETYFLNGDKMSVRGTAAYPTNFMYGADNDGSFVQTIRVRGASTSEWFKTSSDMLQRPFKVSFPQNASYLTPFSQSFYDPVTGQLTKQVDPDGVTVLYAYNPRGELYRRAVDIDQDGNISTVADRVEEYSTSVQPQGPEMLSVKHTYVWDNQTGNPPVRTERLTEASAVDGSYYSSSSFGQTTVKTTSYYPNNAQRVEDTIFPDNTREFDTYVNDNIVSRTTLDSTASPILSTTYQYYTSGPSYGLLQSSTDARNGATSYTYNDADQIATVTSPVPGLGQTTPQVTGYSYDELNPSGRVVTTTFPDLSTRTDRYALTGELAVSEGVGVIPTVYTYEQGRIKQIATSRDLNFSPGSPSGQQNIGDLEVTSFTYTPDRGFLASKTYGNQPGPSYAYYDSGRVQSRTWNNGATTSYTYNTAGDLSTVDYSGTAASPDFTYTYTSRGQISQVVDASGQTGTTIMQYYPNGLPYLTDYRGGPLDGTEVEYDYDSLLRRQALVTRWHGSVVCQQGYGYQQNNSYLENVNMNGVYAHYDYENNSTLVKDVVLKHGSDRSTPVLNNNRQHNNLNQLQQSSAVEWLNVDPLGGPITLTYGSQFNLLGQRQQVNMPDGSYWNHTYDPSWQLSASKKSWSDGSAVAGQNFVYTYDDAGNRLYSSTSADASDLRLRTTQYVANDQNQYVSAAVPGYANILGSASPLATVTVNGSPSVRKNDYFCDELPVDNTAGAVNGTANILAVEWNYGLAHDVSAVATKNINVPPADEIFQYFDDGNLKSDGVFNYAWDDESRLSSVTQSGQQIVTYLYDYLGRRIQKQTHNYSLQGPATSTRTYLYDGWNLIAEFDGSGTLQCSYAWGADDGGSVNTSGAGTPVLLTSSQTAPGTYFLMNDLGGNVTGLFDGSSGAQMADYEYGPFGEPLRTTGPSAAACPLRFAGKYYDQETRLVCYGLRYYNPVLGRWLSRDPIEEEGGVNLYGFSGNDPVNHADLRGLILFDQSSSFALAYLGRVVDPRSYYENFVSGDYERVASEYSYHVLMAPVQLGRALLHPVDTAEFLISHPGVLSDSFLKCILGQKWDEFRWATPERQEEILADLSADGAIAWATGPAGEEETALSDVASAAKIATEPGAEGAFSAADFGQAVANDPIASRAYKILQEQGIDVRFYTSEDSLAGSFDSGSGVVNINLQYNSTVDDALSTLIHEAKHVDLEANTGNAYGLRGASSGEYSARALEFFYQNARRPTAAERAAIQQQIQDLGY